MVSLLGPAAYPAEYADQGGKLGMSVICSNPKHSGIIDMPSPLQLRSLCHSDKSLRVVLDSQKFGEEIPWEGKTGVQN